MDAIEKLQTVEKLLERGHINEIISDEDIRYILVNRKLRIKWGIDPTSTNIHLGRVVPILTLRDLQSLGHHIVLVIGNFTAEVGDTSDKESERPVLTPEQVQNNMGTYLDQIGLIIDLKQTEVRYNKDWWSKMNFDEFIRLADLFSLAEFVARSNIAKRLDDGNRVSLREMLYPIMQGYDSIAIDADIEIGGTDQRFNLLAGRVIQRSYGKRPQSLLMTNLINGLDGRKMSSSWGNTINLMDSPDEIYGKLMSMKDEMIIPYFIHVTREPAEFVETLEKRMMEGTINPRDVKMILSSKIVSLIHGESEAENSADNFKRVFQDKGLPETLPVYTVRFANIIDILLEVGFAESKSSARRLISQGGVRVNDCKVDSIDYNVPDGAILKKGKIKFAKICVSR